MEFKLKELLMSDVKNFVDEKTKRKIIDALCELDFNSIHILADNSGVPVSRLQDFVDNTERITHLDKGKLIIHLVNLMDISEEGKQHEETTEPNFTSLKEFQQRKTG